MQTIWLASKSPRRQEILRQADVPFELLLPDDADAAEALEAVHPGEAPNQYVARVTRAKLDSALQRLVRNNLPARPVLAADTTVAVGGRILGKPANADEGRQMLQLLSGRTHRVLSAVAVARGSNVRQATQVSRVTFARLKPDQIDAYLALGDGIDKAGGYGIQGYAARFVRKIEGSYTGIMGLPIYETLRLLGQ